MFYPFISLKGLVFFTNPSDAAVLLLWNVQPHHILLGFDSTVALGYPNFGVIQGLILFIQLVFNSIYNYNFLLRGFFFFVFEI